MQDYFLYRYGVELPRVDIEDPDVKGQLARYAAGMKQLVDAGALHFGRHDMVAGFERAAVGAPRSVAARLLRAIDDETLPLRVSPEDGRRLADELASVCDGLTEGGVPEREILDDLIAFCRADGFILF